ncbi:hypothetical protein Tco_1130051, partial [Tanacetum coccineum]
MTQKLGNGFEFIKKACFICRSFNHLIKDGDFHDKKMVEKPVLNNKGRVTGQREIRPVWNNAQRVNHQNKFTHPHPKRNFVPMAFVTKSGQVPVNTAKQSSPRAATSISTARPVNTVAPKSKAKVSAAEPKTKENAEFHQIVDFLTTNSIHYALTQIHATVDGKTVVISELSVRSDLHFNDEECITCLTNTAIFENIALMG